MSLRSFATIDSFGPGAIVFRCSPDGIAENMLTSSFSQKEVVEGKNNPSMLIASTFELKDCFYLINKQRSEVEFREEMRE